MTLPVGRARSLALVALPSAAFLVGPLFASVGDGDGDALTLSWLPTVLPAVALVIVGLVVYRRTKRIRVVAAFLVGALAVLVVTAGIYLMSVWPTGG